ncbi:hypothetical protein MNBD_GAMMA04-1794 [hydrothermal vent metagenome]|uniref:Uncharacterized protein n=1 Tax=hydrothermal vent metagenome TaxID=652676 RepID=A0A3B0WYL8_9ZZZZ
MKILKHLIAFAFIFGISSMASAAVPPPPVNQNIGIPDTVFAFQDASVCNNCHGGNPPMGVPVNPQLNEDRHHKKIGEPIDGQPDFPPFRDANGDGVNETTFGCYNCHKIDFNPDTGTNELVQNFRNCLNCHIWNPGDTSVHHKTQRAQNGYCFQCHGGIVRGIDVDTLEGKQPDLNSEDPDATIPVDIDSYRTSMITPWRSGKPNGDDRIVNSAGTSPGNCNFCHNTSDGLPGNETGGSPETFTLTDGTTTVINIFTNIENHHGTGFANEGKCAWCHIEPAGSVQDEIKSCQRCHDRATLHNIEFDAVGDGIQPGQEDAYFGHIGNNANCWGCHGNNESAGSITNQNTDTGMSGSASSAIVPTLISLSTQRIPNGADTVITATGTSFVNTFSGTDNDGVPFEYTYTSQVLLRDEDGNSTIIEPTTMDSTTLTFTLPGSTPIGGYEIVIRKSFQHTNPLHMVVVPSMVATDAFVYSPYGSLVILMGTGFTDGMDMFGIEGGNTDIVDQNGNTALLMYLWTDNLIAAYFLEAPESVTVTNIYGTKTFTLDTLP